MEKLRSLEEYKSLLSSYKKVYRSGYCNNYLNIDMIKRYISLQRIYFETGDKILLFFTDEEKYYRLHALLGLGANIDIKKQDKPIMLRNVYKEGTKPDILLCLEGALKQQGFFLYDETVQILANPLNNKEDIQRKYDKAISFLNRFKIRIGYAQEKDIEQIMNLRDKEPLLKDYHFIYETQDEQSPVSEMRHCIPGR